MVNERCSLVVRTRIDIWKRGSDGTTGSTEMGVEYPLACMRLCYLSDVLVYMYHGTRLLLQWCSNRCVMVVLGPCICL